MFIFKFFLSSTEHGTLETLSNDFQTKQTY